MKHRSSQDFAQTYASDKQGVGISIENFVHLKEESVAGTLTLPSVGTQGKSTGGDTAPSEDISAGSNTDFKAAVDGLAAQTVSLTVAGLNTGALIAAALESGINAALSTAGFDARVWAEWDGSKYIIYSQKTGTSSAVIITDGDSNNVAADLELGVANGGTEAAGTAGGDFLQMTKASLQMNQPKEPSEHRTGRQASSTIKKKKIAEGEFETYFNAPSSGGASVDSAVSLLLEAVMGKKTVVDANHIKYDSTQAQSKYLTAVQGSNFMGRYFNGVYPKSCTISLPGDGEAKMTIPVKARDGLYSFIAQIDGAVSSDTAIIVNANESKRFDPSAPVMICSADGRTITAGADGTLTIDSRNDGSNTLNVSTAVDAEDDGYIVPYIPHVFDQVGTDNPITGLEGTVSFDDGVTTVEEVRSAEITFDPQVEDQDNYYGADTNKGRVIANRSEIMLRTEVLMSVSQAAKVIEAKEFTTFAMKIVLGPASGNRWEFTLPKVEFNVPPVELPDSGSVVLALEGVALQSETGALDALTIAQKAG